MEAIFNNRRDSVLKSLQENQSEIAILNADIEAKIAAHKNEIAKLKLQQKELRQTKMKGGIFGWIKGNGFDWLDFAATMIGGAIGFGIQCIF